MKIDKKAIRPIGRRLLVEVYEGASQTEGGLELANGQSNNAPIMGTVVRIGSGTKFKEGNVVFFRRFALDKLTYSDESGEGTVNLLDEADVLGIADARAEEEVEKALTPREEKLLANNDKTHAPEEK